MRNGLASPCSLDLLSCSSDSSWIARSPAMIDGKSLMMVLGVAETEENRSIDSSYFFCSKRVNAFK